MPQDSFKSFITSRYALIPASLIVMFVLAYGKALEDKYVVKDLMANGDPNALLDQLTNFEGGLALSLDREQVNGLKVWIRDNPVQAKELFKAASAISPHGGATPVR